MEALDVLSVRDLMMEALVFFMRMPEPWNSEGLESSFVSDIVGCLIVGVQGQVELFKLKMHLATKRIIFLKTASLTI